MSKDYEEIKKIQKIERKSEKQLLKEAAEDPNFMPYIGHKEIEEIKEMEIDEEMEIHKEMGFFSDPEDDAEAALKRNEKLAEEGFEVRENSVTVDGWDQFGEMPIGAPVLPKIEEGSYKERYYRVLDIVKDLIDELKMQKDNK